MTFHCYLNLSYAQFTASVYIRKDFFILTCDASVMDLKLALFSKLASRTASVTGVEMA